jgi:hypothetical protein
MTRTAEPVMCAAAVVAIAFSVGGCATTSPITLDASQQVGVAIIGPGPAVSFPTAAGGDGRVVATVVLGAVVSVLGVFAGRPDAVFHVPGAVKQEADRAACVAASYEGHPDLVQEISGIVARDFPPNTVAEVFLADFKVRAGRKGHIVRNPDGTALLSHESAIREAKAVGVDVLFELVPEGVSFEYAGQECIIHPRVGLAYRVLRVDRDQELVAGRAFGNGSSEALDTPAPQTLSRWLDGPGSLAKEIESGYADAVSEIWYVRGGRGGPRFVLPWPTTPPQDSQ